MSTSPWKVSGFSFEPDFLHTIHSIQNKTKVSKEEQLLGKNFNEFSQLSLLRISRETLSFCLYIFSNKFLLLKVVFLQVFFTKMNYLFLCVFLLLVTSARSYSPLCNLSHLGLLYTHER